jgi:TetR/AcrR family transcriptional regulator, transcriptional repressor for nem operon
VARYGKEHKQQTRQRIIAAAGRRLKQDGIDGSGVAALMADADLTNGAFYAHFGSKDELVAAAVADQLRSQQEWIGALAGTGRAGLEQIAREYLSPEHRDNLGGGCASAALLDEIGRCNEATRMSYTDGVMGVVDALAAVLVDQPDRNTARMTALGIYALLTGTLQLSRAITDRKLADEILEQGIANTLALPGVPDG